MKTTCLEISIPKEMAPLGATGLDTGETMRRDHLVSTETFGIKRPLFIRKTVKMVRVRSGIPRGNNHARLRRTYGMFCTAVRISDEGKNVSGWTSPQSGVDISRDSWRST